MTPPPDPARPRIPWRLFVFAGAIAALVLAAGYGRVEEFLREALDWIGRLGPWGPVLFIAVYVVATVLFVPGSVLTLGAGAVFGVAMGCLCVSIGSTLGATCAFLLGRHLARDAIARRMQGNARFAAIERSVATGGWKVVILTRLSPVFPFALLNYAFGLTRVSLRDYVLASWIGMMPATVMYVYLGSLAKAAAGGRMRTAGEWVLYGAGLVATVVVTVWITRAARQALAMRV